jgi:NADH-quinone oxidoreductase subunit L
VTFLVATLAIAGVPLFSGFYSKDMILGAALEFGMKSANPVHMILFIGALCTAGLTAFYMFRLVILTFLGKPKDHHKFEHAHESPPNMWVPLVVLAGLSFSFWYSGWFGNLVKKPAAVIPVAVHAAAHEASVAAPGEAGSHRVATAAGEHGAAVPGHAPAAAAGPHGAPTRAGEHMGGAAHDEHIAHVAHKWAMILSVVFAFSGIGLAFVVYSFGWIDPDRVANAVHPVYVFLKNKWYFDELYDKTAIAWTIGLSRAMAWFDNNIVDGLVNLVGRLGVWASFLVGKFDNAVVDGAVNGVATVTIESGSFIRRLQTGKLYHYVFVLAGGVLIIFLVKAF